MEASLSDLYQLEEMRENSSDNSGDNSPPSTTFSTSISSPKRSRRAIQKRVVTFPIKDIEGSRFKGDCTPPSDSWAWRKYGQKPIKGSPYPRGYYRCSSSKGCPARKQVERSRTDPNTLVITYSYEHNHPWPASRNHQNRQTATTTTTSTTPLIAPQTITTTKINQIDVPKLENNNFNQPVYIPNNSHIIINGCDHTSTNASDPIRIPSDPQNHQQMESLIVPNTTDDLGWFTDHHHHHQHHQDGLDTSFLTSCDFSDLDMAKIFPMREEDESLFADLGELPECSLVFRQAAGGEEQRRPCGLTAPWCGASTG